MNIQIETITPEGASVWLQDRANPNNRNLDRSNLARLVSDMESGRWRAQAGMITTNVDGMIIDGHTRLNAVVKSGVTIQCLVQRGAPKNTIEGQGGGKVRTGGDVLKIAGFKNPTNLASAIKWWYRFQSGRAGVAHGGPPLSESQILQLARAMVGLPAFVKQVGSSGFPAMSLNRYAIAAFAYTLATEGDDRAKNKIVEFTDGVVEGCNLAKNDPRMTYRRKLIQTKAQEPSRRPEIQDRITHLIRAWNAFYSDETPATLPVVRPKYSALKGDVLPKVEGWGGWTVVKIK